MEEGLGGLGHSLVVDKKLGCSQSCILEHLGMLGHTGEHTAEHNLDCLHQELGILQERLLVVGRLDLMEYVASKGAWIRIPFFILGYYQLNQSVYKNEQ